MIQGVLLAGVVLLHLSVVSGGDLNVAPADFDSNCHQHASPYRSTEKILLDTQYYESQSLIDVQGNSEKWLSLDFDNIVGKSLPKVRTDEIIMYIYVYMCRKINVCEVRICLFL